MKLPFGLILLTCLTVTARAQLSEDLRQRFDSAQIEFDNFEKQHGDYVKTKNVDMHFLKWGNSKNTPLIWIHGSYTNAYELEGLANDIVARGYYLIAIDYYGHGLTKIPSHEVSPYHVADDIKELMDKLKIRKAVIGGWSRGGVIATAFYDAYPHMVLGLILEDGGSVSSNSYYHKLSDEELTLKVESIFTNKITYPCFESQFEAYQAFYDQEVAGSQYTLLAWITTDAQGSWTIDPGLEELFHMSDRDEFLKTILRPTSATLFAQSMASIEPKIVFRNLNVPVLILDPTGENDLFPFQNENRDLKKMYPDLIVYREYKNTGHNIHFEKPIEFVSDLNDFLQKIKKFCSR